MHYSRLMLLPIQQVSAAQYQQSFTSPIHSLEHERGRVQYPEWLESNVLGASWTILLPSKELRWGSA